MLSLACVEYSAFIKICFCVVFFSQSKQSLKRQEKYFFLSLKNACQGASVALKARFPYDRPDRPCRLKKCSEDRDDHIETLPRRSQTTRFASIYTIVPIVRIALSSIQAIEVFSVARVVCDRLGSISIWSSLSSEHFWDDWDDPDAHLAIWKPGFSQQKRETVAIGNLNDAVIYHVHNQNLQMCCFLC